MTPPIRDDWRQFALQGAIHFGTFMSVRKTFASMALLAGISATSAQEQEGKLIDRVLKPNMSLVNSAEGKQFDTASSFVTRPVPSKSFYTPDNSLAKPFPAARHFSTRQFAAGHFRAGEMTALIPDRSQSINVSPIQIASASSGTGVARENGRNLPLASFAGERPFLGRGKSQKALSAQDTPLTIEQVRELLNKTK